MIAKGYTEKQVRLLCEWYCRKDDGSLRDAAGRADRTPQLGGRSHDGTHRRPAAGQQEQEFR